MKFRSPAPTGRCWNLSIRVVNFCYAVESMSSFEKFEKADKPEEVDIEQILKQEQNLHIQLAKEYLPKGDWLREQIIDYYSDTERLKEELAKVYEDMSQKEALAKLKRKKTYTATRKNL